MGLNIEKSSDTVNIKVLVQFNTRDGAVYQGDFIGAFKRLTQSRIDEFLDTEAGYTVSEVVREILVGVSGVARGSEEMPQEEALAWVLQSPECVNAAYAAFFKAMRPERYSEKTSKRARAGG